MDEGSGNHVADSSGNGNDGTLNLGSDGNTNAALARMDGVRGKALEFDGADDHVEVPHSNLDIRSEATLSMWIKTSDTSHYQYLMNIRCATTGGNRYGVWFRISGDDNRIWVTLGDGSGTADDTLKSETSVGDGNWHHIAFTRNGGSWKIYVDGAEDATDMLHENDVAYHVNYDDRYLGIMSGMEYPFSGIIDEVGIYDRALSAEEIRGHYDRIINGSHYSDDGWGGSWSDEFLDNTGIGTDINASVCDGAVVLDNGTAPRPGCAGYWRFDEVTGNIAYDDSGNVARGRLRNMDGGGRVTGVSGNALEFDGVDDHLEIGDYPKLDFDDRDFTLSAWVNPADGNDMSGLIFMKKTDAGVKDWHTNYNFGIGDYYGKCGNGQLFFEAGDGSWSEIVTSRGSIDGDWNMITVVYDSSDSRITFYINGLRDSDAFLNIDPGANDHPLIIGKHTTEAGNDNYLFHGSMDDVRIYCRALRECEIEEHYSAMPPPPVGMWHFDEVGGNQAGDGSGNGNDGMLHNMNDDDWIAGKVGNALSFDGLDDWVDISSVRKRGAFSMEAWIKLNVKSSVWDECQLIASKYINGQPAVDGEWFVWIDEIDDKLDFYIRDGGQWYITTSNTVFVENMWYHVAAVFDGLHQRVYVNGAQEAVDRRNSLSVDASDTPMAIGADGDGMEVDFNGIIDEIAIYNRTLTPHEITRHQQLDYETRRPFLEEGSVRSKNITLPANMTWRVFRAERTVPQNTYLNCTLCDARTNDVLVEDTGSGESIEMDLSSVNHNEHRTVYMKAAFRSNVTHAPSLLNWSVNWTRIPPEAPELIEDIPDEIVILEDTPAGPVLDLLNHFYDQYSRYEEPTYNIEDGSDNGNITLIIVGANLSVTALADNWTGDVSVTVNCTNMHGYTTLSNAFDIVVMPINDIPAWRSRPTAINFPEDGNYTDPVSMDSYFVDAEDDELEYLIGSLDGNIHAMLDDNGSVTVSAERDYNGESVITLGVREKHNRSAVSGNITIPVVVDPVNDPPRVELLAPGDNVSSSDGTITLRWKGYDVDDASENITYDLYLGKNDEPSLFMSDLMNENHTLTDLVNGATYRWKVIPNDGKDQGSCTNGSRSFSIDKNIFVPEIELLSPRNGSILVETVQNITWKLRFHSGEGVTCYVFLGTSPESLTEIGPTDRRDFELRDLENGVTYFWKIEVSVTGIEGRVSSEVFSFTIEKDFIAEHDIELYFTVDSIELVRGDSITINITIRNRGNVAEKVDLSVFGDLKEHVTLSFDPTVDLDPDEEKTVIMVLFAKLKLEAKTYELVVKGDYSGMERTARVNVTVKKEAVTSPSEREGALPWLWFGVAVILLVAVVGLLIILLRRPRKGQEEAGEMAIEAEIEMHPQGGITRSEIEQLALSDGAPEHFQGRLAEMPAPMPMEYTLPGQVQQAAYQHRSPVHGPTVNLPQLRVTGETAAAPALPQVSSVPTGGTPQMPYPTAEQAGAMTPAVTEAPVEEIPMVVSRPLSQDIMSLPRASTVPLGAPVRAAMVQPPPVQQAASVPPASVQPAGSVPPATVQQAAVQPIQVPTVTEQTPAPVPQALVHSEAPPLPSIVDELFPGLGGGENASEVGGQQAPAGTLPETPPQEANPPPPTG